MAPQLRLTSSPVFYDETSLLPLLISMYRIFHLQYNEIFIDLQQWIERAPAEDLHLPVPNVFIPTDLSLKNVSEQVSCFCYFK